MVERKLKKLTKVFQTLEKFQQPIKSLERAESSIQAEGSIQAETFKTNQADCTMSVEHSFSLSIMSQENYYEIKELKQGQFNQVQSESFNKIKKVEIES